MRHFANMAHHSERTDGAGDQHFVSGAFAGFARDFYAFVIQANDFIFAEARSEKFHAIRAEGICLDQVRARVDVILMNAENRFGLRGIQFLEAALLKRFFVELRTHCAIGDENGIPQPRIEIINSHLYINDSRNC